MLTQSTLNCVWCQHISILVTSTHYLPFHYSQYKHFETRIFKAVSSPTFRCETCVKKLQLLSSCKPSVGCEAHTRHTEREDLGDKVEQIIQRTEEAKENNYVILRTKVQVCMYVTSKLLLKCHSLGLLRSSTHCYVWSVPAFSCLLKSNFNICLHIFIIHSLNVINLIVSHVFLPLWCLKNI